MKKIVVIFVVRLLILALAYGGASYWVGGRALKLHDQSIARINGSKGLKASVVSYQRGLFKSTALTRLTLLLPRKGRSVSFELVDTIYHGPFVFLHDQHLESGLRPVMAVIRTRLASGSGSGLEKALDKVPELASSEVLTVLSINGSAHSYFDIPPFKHGFPDDKGGQMEVKWGGLSGKFNFDARLGKSECFFSSPSLLVKQQGRQLRIVGVRARFDSHAGIKGVSVGSSDFTISDVEAVENGHSDFALDSLGLKTQSTVEGDKINGSIHLDFARLNAGLLGLGPSRCSSMPETSMRLFLPGSKNSLRFCSGKK